MKALYSILILLSLISCNEYRGSYARMQERDTLSTLEEITRSGGTEVGPAALRVIPGNSWTVWRLSDSTFALLSQDSRDTTQTIVREDSLLAWINANANVTNNIYQVDSLPVMYSSSFALNSRIINRGTGAMYKIQSSAVSGYTTDSIFVVPTGSYYAVLESYAGNIYFSHVNQPGNDDTEIFTKMGEFASVQNDITTLMIDERMYLTDSVRLPAGVSLVGTNHNERVRTLGTTYQTVFINMADAGKTAITLEDHASGVQYSPGGTIANINFETISDCYAVLNLIRPGWYIVEKIMIYSGPTQPTNYYDRKAEFGILANSALKTIFRDIEVLNAKQWGISMTNGATTVLDNCRIAFSANGLKVDNMDIEARNLVIVSMDDVAIQLEGGSELVIRELYTEDIPVSLGSDPIIKIINGSIDIYGGQIASEVGHTYQSIEVDTSNFVRLHNLGFANGYQTISTTDQSGYIYLQNVGERGRTVYNGLYGITDITKLTVIGGYLNFSYGIPKNLFYSTDIKVEDVVQSDIDSLNVFAELGLYNDTIRAIGAYNLFRRSEELNNTTPWSLPGTDHWIATANDTIAPDGTTTADLLTYSAAGYAHNIPDGSNFVVGTEYTFSFYARAVTGSPTFEVFIEQSGVDPTNTVSITSGQWTRYSVTLTPTATITAIGFRMNAGTAIHLWGMQAVQGSIAGPYVMTGATAITSGTVKVDGKMNFLDSVMVSGISILSGTAAPASGIGVQGSLYIRNDNDSTLYSKTGSGWVLMN